MTCTQADHNAIKSDEIAWALMDFIGVQHIEADETGPAETLELRNCLECHSTLCKLVSLVSL